MLSDERNIIGGLLQCVFVALVNVLAGTDERFVHGDRVEIRAEALQVLPTRAFGIEALLSGLAPLFDRAHLHRELELPLRHLGKPGAEFIIAELL